MRRPLPPLPGEAAASLSTLGRVRGAGARPHRPGPVVCEVTDGWSRGRRKQVFKKRVGSCPPPGRPPLPGPLSTPCGFPVARPRVEPLRGARACLRGAGALAGEFRLPGAHSQLSGELSRWNTGCRRPDHLCLAPQNRCLRPGSGEGKPELARAPLPPAPGGLPWNLCGAQIDLSQTAKEAGF